MGHCGIVAVTNPHMYYSYLEPAWMKIIEEYLYRQEFSMILASDGPYRTARFIREQGKHWIEISKNKDWINRRMGESHDMHLFCRYLNAPKPELLIDCSDK
jgi:hypothetical protein